MTNFDRFLTDPQFTSFAEAAAAAEKILQIDVAACILNCRRAMEHGVKWMYSVDSALVKPWQDTLVNLMNDGEFREIVGGDVWKRMDHIRRMGNAAAHGNKALTRAQAELCLENLYIFLDLVAYCYGSDYQEGEFDRSLLEERPALPAPAPVPDVDLDALIAENQALRAELTARREEQEKSYVPKPLDLTEYETRRLYIDAMLLDAGWTRGQDWLDEVELHGMPNKSGTGYADYVLYGSDGRPLAVVEAKRTCDDPARGRQQAKLYAGILEEQYGRRPVVFLTNGFDTRIDDGVCPERKVAAIFSKRDLEKWSNLRSMRTSLAHVTVDKSIAGRWYQESAVKAVCGALERGRRKALLVMATGSGKTRTTIALCDVLQRHGWVKNILFLADRNSLVTQAKRSFADLLPSLSASDLCEEKNDTAARCVFSTYQTMMSCIDSVRDEEGKLFTCGHFDLVICDEAHRSIYNKYRDIFSYFDAPLVGLTATPKDEIDKNTYEVFELADGEPTFGYELAQAVTDGFLVDFMSVETRLRFLEEGISYDRLSDEDKAAFEDTFRGGDGELPERIGPSALNEWVFNEDTIREALDILMTYGLKIDHGEKLGKTIIFAKNHTHAEKILEIFGREYPHLPGYAMVIDNYLTYAQSAIDDFSDPDELPQIAISVDMLDTGIDVPEVLNLVFFKKVMSKAKFWQMIGRGTRLCPGLLDGADKEKFYIFDLCGNFEFFRMDGKGGAAVSRLPVRGAVFQLKAQIAYQLQEPAHQTEELTAFRQRLTEDMTAKVRGLDRGDFAVRQHLRYVEKFSSAEGWAALSYQDTLDIREELAPLIAPDGDDPQALRFDALMYGIELAWLIGEKHARARKDLLKKVQGIGGMTSIPEIQAQSELIGKILRTDYLDGAGIGELEHIRESLRDLMRYIPTEIARYTTNFDDEILSIDWKEAQLENDDLKNYKAKAEHYVRQHQDEAVIAKLKGNVPLTPEDVTALERILWSEVGSRQDYEAELGAKPLGEFVREIVGLDMRAAKEAFSEYLTSTDLDSRQIYFVDQIVEYIVRNGMMKDLSVLQEPPFTDRGSVVEVFTDLSLWLGIKAAIDRINANAAVS